MDAGAIDRSFVIHLKAVFDPEKLREIRAHLEAAGDALQDRAGCDREQRALSRGEGSDALRLDHKWMEAWRSPSAALLEALGEHTWVCYPCQVRQVSKAPEHYVPWHQDAAFIQLMGARAHRRIVTVFVPLDENPAQRTTLSFGPRQDVLLPHQELNGFGAGLPDWTGDGEWFPTELGDALFFGDLAPHRTFTPPGADVRRASLEFRLASREEAIQDKDYFDIRSGTMVRLPS